MVGQFVLAELLQHGGQLALLVRGRKDLDVRLRVDALCQFWERRLGRALPRPKCIASDLGQEGLGISVADQHWIAQHVDAVLHNAASVRFLQDERGIEPMATNIDGTKRLLKVAHQLQVPRFHHVSTAFICGKRTGWIPEEDVDVGQEFNNPYEASKCQAEKLVLESKPQFESVSIYRPSVVVGDSRDGFTSTFQTIYSVIRFLVLLNDGERADTMKLFQTFSLTGKEMKNLVNVDWVAKTMVKLLHEPKSWGRIYHLTNPQPTSLATVAEALAAATQAVPQAWQALSDSVSQLSLPAAAQESLRPFAGYFSHDPTFATDSLQPFIGNDPAPQITREGLEQLFRYAIEQKLQTRVYPIRAHLPSWYPSLDQTNRGDAMNSASQPTSLYRIQLLGESGGCWDVPLASEMNNGVATDEIPQVRTTTQVWNALVHGQISLANAMNVGRFLILAPANLQSLIHADLSTQFFRPYSSPETAPTVLASQGGTGS